MAKAQRGEAEATPKKENVAPEKLKDEKKKERQKKEAAAPAPVPSGLKITFGRWFASRGFKPHWRPGMEAFTNVSGLHTVEEWDKLFKAY
jgi:hypothetical protein